MWKHWKEYRDGENKVQVAYNLVKEKETQHRIIGKFHYDDAKEQTAKTQSGWVVTDRGILNVGTQASRDRKKQIHACV